MTSSDAESADAEHVDEALQALARGDLSSAESLLLSVIANTPRVYEHSLEAKDSLSIKFWGQQEFVHYVMWQEKHGSPRGVTWLRNAYPRAHYYMGFLCVKRKQFERAVQFLDKGMILEPTNPKFKFEKAQALLHSGRKAESLALYDEVNEIGPYVTAHDLAMARRGRGFVLIELGRLDEAEAAFKASLEIDPGNKVALHELAYIDHLRRDGAPKPPEMVATTSPGLSECGVCGKRLEKGVVVLVNEAPVSICKECRGKLTKRWWQFWK
jgi:tetratricopeptide (TPR) repeat protein